MKQIIITNVRNFAKCISTSISSTAPCHLHFNLLQLLSNSTFLEGSTFQSSTNHLLKTISKKQQMTPKMLKQLQIRTVPPSDSPTLALVRANKIEELCSEALTFRSGSEILLWMARSVLRDICQAARS
jgi:hypothetical protein